ncbi:MAG: hypothetical protein ACRCS3_01720 [Paracoccaceae bacterium]
MGLLGGSCLAESLSGGVPMPQETHGGAMYTIPAELWSGIVLMTAAMISVGVITDRLWMTFVGGLIGAITYWALFVFADYASFGFLLSRGSGVLGVLHVGIAVAAAFDMVCRWAAAGIEEYAKRLK